MDKVQDKKVGEEEGRKIMKGYKMSLSETRQVERVHFQVFYYLYCLCHCCRYFFYQYCHYYHHHHYYDYQYSYLDLTIISSLNVCMYIPKRGHAHHQLRVIINIRTRCPHKKKRSNTARSGRTWHFSFSYKKVRVEENK